MRKVNIFETQLNYKKISHSLESVCVCENSPGVQNLVHFVLGAIPTTDGLNISLVQLAQISQLHLALAI